MWTQLFTGKISPALLHKCKDHAWKVYLARADQDKANDDEGEHRYMRKLIGKIGEVGAGEAGYEGEIDWKIWERPASLPDLGDNI